jgi:hypothetical protein
VRVPSRDELLALVNQKTAEQVMHQISNEYRANTDLAYEAAAAGKYDDAAYHARELRRLENEALPYVQAMTQQQQQSPYTPAEQDLIRDYPQIASDPKKWATAQAAANNLIMRGYDRNSAEYISAIAHACDVLNSDLTESNEVASPNTALAACQSKYGATTVAEYNAGVQRLAEEKKLGMRPMSQ